jgi:hypothetical protein
MPFMLYFLPFALHTRGVSCSFLSSNIVAYTGACLAARRSVLPAFFVAVLLHHTITLRYTIPPPLLFPRFILANSPLKILTSRLLFFILRL